MSVGSSTVVVLACRRLSMIADRTESLGGEELVAADVDARQHDDGMAGVHLFDPDADEAHRKVDLSPRESSGTLWGVRRHVSHISETLQLQQLVGDELRSDAHTGERLHRSLDPEREGLRRRLGGGGLRTQPEKARGPGQGQSTHEAASTRAFASVTHRAPLPAENVTPRRRWLQPSTLDPTWCG